ncbi:MAG: hypothetical protein ABJR05_11085 [Balneola sp.]
MSNVQKPREKREASESEAKHKTARIVTSLIPFGSTVYELFTAISQPLYEKRIEEWRTKVALRLIELEQEQKVNIKELSENDEFVSLLTKASLDAIQFHQQEKLKVLKAIVINSALEINSGTLDYEEQNMFLRIVDRIDATQFIMLKMFYKPNDYLNAIGKSEFINTTDRIATLFRNAYPDLKDEIDLLSQMWVELNSFGLVSSPIFANQFSINPVTSKSNVITSFGERFLEVIDNQIQ